VSSCSQCNPRLPARDRHPPVSTVDVCPTPGAEDGDEEETDDVIACSCKCSRSRCVSVTRRRNSPRPRRFAPSRFEGGWNIGVWAAQRQGFFEASGVSVQLTYTPNSAALVTGLYDGRYDIAMATIDNFVAYQEGQGEAKLAGDPDFVVVMGGDGGFLSVVAGPQVKSFADLRARRFRSTP
jgi:hypothetical protein